MLLPRRGSTSLAGQAQWHAALQRQHSTASEQQPTLTTVLPPSCTTFALKSTPIVGTSCSMYGGVPHTWGMGRCQ